MNNRIRKFMESQGLSPSELADSIGVQRSNVSHVLNGRNLPSFPFIEKLLKKYPKLNAKWLLMGEGEMMEGKPLFDASLFSSVDSNPVKSPEVIKENKIIIPPTTPSEAIKNQVSDVKQSAPDLPDEKFFSEPEKPMKSQPQVPLLPTNDKTIDKIILFYTDHTFTVYHPSL